MINSTFDEVYDLLGKKQYELAESILIKLNKSNFNTSQLRGDANHVWYILGDIAYEQKNILKQSMHLIYLTNMTQMMLMH